MRSKQGFVEFNGYKTWYTIYGDLRGAHTPLVALHGGPGYSHDYLNNLSKLAKTKGAVILYDQLGCGKSDRPDNPRLWTIQLYVDELNAVRGTLCLDTVSILGHSWGGALALEYMFSKPKGVEKLILNSPLLDSRLWVKEAERLKDLLSPEVAAKMRQHEQAGTTNSQEYHDAYEQFQQRFVIRLKPYPKVVEESDKIMNRQVYETMWGPSEAYATGNLKGWSALDRLQQITTPTLIISGKYDEATPSQMELAHKGIKGSKWVLLEHSSHTANLEEPEKYLAAITDFLG